MLVNGILFRYRCCYAATDNIPSTTVLLSKFPKKPTSNVVGVKLTWEITHLAAALKPSEFIGGMATGSAGCIAALAIVLPKSLVRIYTLYTAGRFDEAMALHQNTILAENACNAGIAST
jgi:2-keto-3-deoxy-L-rhamnonate aldolase